MRKLTENELLERLAAHPDPEPPAGLAERIKAEIDLEGTSNLPTPIRRPAQTWLIAAGLAAAVATGGYLALRLQQPEPAAEQIADSRATVPAATPIAKLEERQAESDDLDRAPREIEEGEASALRKKVEAPKPQAARKVPIPDPTPAEADQLLSIPAPPSPPPPPPLALPAPPAPQVAAPSASRRIASERRTAMPAPRNAPAREFKDEITVSGQAQTMDSRSISRGTVVSVGGSAEPNDAPYGDVFYKGYGINPFIDTEDDNLSTFGLDVDTASYTVLRRYLSDGHLPPADAVRVEEMVNYFDYRDPTPETGDFATHAEGAPSLFGEGERYYLLRFNLRGREIPADQRPPAHLTFVVDVSGSMAEENRLELVKKALRLLVEQLRSDDRVGLVVYGSRGEVVLEPTGDREAILRAIERLQPAGSTNAEEGLRLGYQLAARDLRPKTIHRVILCSDGVANVGRTGPESILAEIRRDAQRGIELTTVGFGMGNYNDVLMEQLADQGNGRYAYVDSLDEARRIFVEDLSGTLQTIAAEARVQVRFNPDTVSRYRLIGYENRDIADTRFRDDTVDAGEIGAGHSVTALYEIKLRNDLKSIDPIATLYLRYASLAKGEMVETSHQVTGKDFALSWQTASPALRLTSLVAEFAEILKGSYWAKSGDLDKVFRETQKVSAEFPGDVDVAELATLVGKAARVRGEDGPGGR